MHPIETGVSNRANCMSEHWVQEEVVAAVRPSEPRGASKPKREMPFLLEFCAAYTSLFKLGRGSELNNGQFQARWCQRNRNGDDGDPKSTWQYHHSAWHVAFGQEGGLCSLSLNSPIRGAPAARRSIARASRAKSSTPAKIVALVCSSQ